VNPEIYIHLDLVLQLKRGAARSLKQALVSFFPDRPNDGHEE